MDEKIILREMNQSVTLKVEEHFVIELLANDENWKFSINPEDGIILDPEFIRVISFPMKRNVLVMNVDSETGADISYEKSEYYYEPFQQNWNFIAKKAGDYIVKFNNGIKCFEYEINVIE